MTSTEVVIKNLPATPEYCFANLDVSLLCMSKTEWSGWAQVVATTITLALLLWQVWSQMRLKRENALGQVLAQRNVAHFVSRYIVRSLGPELLKRKDVSAHADYLEVCMREFEKLPRSELSPAHLVQTFVSLVVKSHEFVKLLKRSADNGLLADEELRRVKELMISIEADMKDLDRHLIANNRESQLIDGNWNEKTQAELPHR